MLQFIRPFGTRRVNERSALGGTHPGENLTLGNFVTLIHQYLFGAPRDRRLDFEPVLGRHGAGTQDRDVEIAAVNAHLTIIRLRVAA